VARLIRSDALVRDISIRLELDPTLAPVRGDRVQLQQVLLNLALNGMDAMQELRTGERALVFRTARDRPGAIRVAVRDSGIGIGGRDVEHMFQAFYTTKAGGMGIGLTIARSIIEAHDGELEAENNPGGGATFSFTLPVSRGRAMTAPTAPLVFIVDDDSSVRRSLARPRQGRRV
jgi:signal transduction histidine kinase